jgi:cytosine/adenosine deaminase-related metal-dependent hydrolase
MTKKLNAEKMPTIYSARWLLPIHTAPIFDGAIAIGGSQIVAVGPKGEVAARFPDAPTFNFDEAAILPGFVNGHSHLELTVMRGFLEDVEHDFFRWLQKLTLARMALSDDDLRTSAICGAMEAARAGITCVGDSSSLAVETMKAVREVGLRGIVYQESFGPDPKLASENLGKLGNQLVLAREVESSLVSAGVSPHAPYTVSAPQLEMISRLAIDEKLPLMMHAAESKAEREFMLKGTGPFAAGLIMRGIEWRAPGTSTIQYLAQHGILETKPLLAHCLNVDDADLELIKGNGASVAHCPKSNAKLGHGQAPFAAFVASEVNVGLGTDSVASNNTCDILEEARFAMLLSRLNRGTGPCVSQGSDLDAEVRVLPHGRASAPLAAADALFAATFGGARALGLDNQIGALAEGMQADITIVRLDGIHQQPVHNAVDTLIFSSSGRDVALTMVAGKEVYRDGGIVEVNKDELQPRLREVRSKLKSTAMP